MHILVVHQYYLSGSDGGGSRFNQFAKYWSTKGHQITVLAGMVHYTLSQKRPGHKGKFIVVERESESIKVIRCHTSESYNKSSLGRMWGYVSFFLSSTLAGLFVKKPDIILCTSPPLTVGPTGVVLSKLKRKPMVFEVRDLWPESIIELGAVRNKFVIKLLYWMQKITYKCSKHINVLTPAFERVLIEQSKIPKSKLSMVPNGADLDIIKPGPRDNWVREKHNLGDKYVVSYLGGLGVAQAPMQLIEAAKLLKEEIPEVQLLIVGDGMEKQKLIERVENENLKNVTFVDSIPKSKVSSYINASDACTAMLKGIDVYKTVYPNKVFDYMSAARPVIIAIDGVAKALVEEADAGVFAKPENPHAFVAAVRKLKENPNLAEEMGQNGLRYVSENFSREALAYKYLDILQKLVKN